MVMPGARATAADFIHEARDAMLEECDFLLEADRQQTFFRLFARDETIRVPEVEREWCGPSVLTTRWLAGQTLEQFLASNPSQAQRDRAGIALFRFYVGTLYRHGLFHADPHPGNYAFQENGRVVVYDFGCVRKFDRPTVAAFAALVSAVRADDTPGMRSALIALGSKVPGDRAMMDHVRALLRGAFAPLVQTGPHPMEAGLGLVASEVLEDKRMMMRLALPGRLLFLFRLRFGLYAVLARLVAVADWSALESAWAQEAGRGA
jgi:predicted unusual protein kinase regulating ubiquinone biosynthesis (AarF/ABC1/UbiB family)